MSSAGTTSTTTPAELEARPQPDMQTGLPPAAPAVDMEAVRQPQDRGSRSFLRQALRDTFQQTAARLGALWVIVLATLAVLAPLIANTHPVLMKPKGGGGWSSPMLRNLSAVDVTLLAAGACALALVVSSRLRRPRTLLVMGGIVVVTAVLGALIANPIVTMDWSRYRDMARAGQFDSVIWTVIPYSPGDRNTDAPIGEHPARPTRKHWLGTERNGADMLSQMIHASRIALAIGFVSTGIAATIGVIIGAIMGYFGGWADLLGMRLIEIMQALRRLSMLLAIAALLGPNLFLLMVVIGLTGWTSDARFIRAEFLRLRNQDFVQAAIAAGLPLRSILFRHMLANGITPVLINSSFGVASAILLEAVLAFLGLGDPDRPSWGGLLNQARSGGANFNWWIAVFPGLAIFLTVFAYNLVGEAMRDALDPKLRKRD